MNSTLILYLIYTHNYSSPDFGDAVISGLLTQPGIVIRGYHVHSVHCLPSRMLLSHLHTNNSAILFHTYPSLCSEDLTSPVTIHHLGRTVEAFWSVKSLADSQNSQPYASMNTVPEKTNCLKQALHNVCSQSKIKTFSQHHCIFFSRSCCHKRFPACSNYATYF